MDLIDNDNIHYFMYLAHTHDIVPTAYQPNLSVLQCNSIIRLYESRQNLMGMGSVVEVISAVETINFGIVVTTALRHST